MLIWLQKWFNLFRMIYLKKYWKNWNQIMKYLTIQFGSTQRVYKIRSQERLLEWISLSSRKFRLFLLVSRPLTEKNWIKMHWKQQGSYLLWNQMVLWMSPRLDWNRLRRCWWPNHLLTTLGCWWRHLSPSDRCLAPKSIREIGHWHSIFWVVTNISNVTDIDWSTTCP